MIADAYKVAQERLGKIGVNGNHLQSEAQTSPASPPEATPAERAEGFYAYLPDHKYICVATGALWGVDGVNVLGEMEHMPASKWLDTHRAVQQMTWAPGLPRLIEDRVVSNGGWQAAPGYTCFNLYKPPGVGGGDAADVEPWLKHIRNLYGDEGAHVVKWFAQRVQRPDVKINHALVLGGAPGIGKDTILEPVRYAVGAWNFNEITPTALLGRFNKFVKSVILRVSEARDLGDVNRYALYEHMKIYTAAPPEVLPVDEKNVSEYSIPNVVGVVITTNHRTDGLYLPADDRRHYVLWSEARAEQFEEGYWTNIYEWYEQGGRDNVAAYLATLDLSDFDPKAPPIKTRAFWDIVNASRAPEDAELEDVLEKLGKPDALTLDMLQNAALQDPFAPDFAIFLKDRRNAVRIPHRLESAGYVAIHNSGQKDGRWKVNKKNVVIYAKTEMSIRGRIIAAEALIVSQKSP